MTEGVGATVVPRWEWRTFGDLEDVNETLATVRSEDAATSDETYVLSLYTDASVKVRAGLLDVKVLKRVDGSGLQLWVPIMKTPFPLDGDAVDRALGALGVTSPPSGSGRRDVTDLIGSRGDLRAVEVHKRRHRGVLDGCMVEYTDLTADGVTTRTVAVESPDRALVIETIDRLGLAGRRNTCVAAGLKGLLGWGPDRFGVVDVGTNSVKFVLAGRREDGTPYTELDTAVVTRLGEGLAEAGELTPASMGRTADAVADLVGKARSGGPVAIVAVGTAGLRQAPNRDAFLDLVLERCGLAIEVISGPEEARLAYLAATSTLPGSGGRLLVFDSGGGSSQFTVGTRTRIDEQYSVDVGAVAVTERFGLTEAVPRDTVDAALAGIAQGLEGLEGKPRPDQVIAIGGTSTNLAAVHHGLTTYDPDVVHGTVLDLAEVDRQIETYRQRSADQRRAIPGLQPARAEVILAGACIVRTILTLSGQDAATVSDRGLRHGVLAERFAGHAR